MPRPGATIVSSLDPMRVRRVHQHDARDDGRIEQFIDQLGVMAGHSGCREQSIQAVAAKRGDFVEGKASRSEEHTSELQSLMRISSAVFCLTKKKTPNPNDNTITIHPI